MNMRTTLPLTLLLALATLSACGEDAPLASFDTEGWIDTMPPSQPPPNPNHAEGGGDEDDEDEEGEDEGEEEGEEDPGAFWAIWGAYADGMLSETAGEMFAFDGSNECVFFYEVTIVSTLDDCSECTAAWEFELGATEVEVDQNGACSNYGIDSVAGTRIKLGFAGEVLMRDAGEGWAELGEAIVEEGELFMEWPDGS